MFNTSNIFQLGTYLRYLGGDLNPKRIVDVEGKEIVFEGQLCCVIDIFLNQRLVMLRFPQLDRDLSALEDPSEFEVVESWVVPVEWVMTARIHIPKELHPTLDAAIAEVKKETFPLPTNNAFYLEDSFTIDEEVLPELND